MNPEQNQPKIKNYWEIDNFVTMTVLVCHDMFSSLLDDETRLSKIRCERISIWRTLRAEATTLKVVKFRSSQISWSVIFLIKTNFNGTPSIQCTQSIATLISNRIFHIFFQPEIKNIHKIFLKISKWLC